jgi:hypothetical protein
MYYGCLHVLLVTFSYYVCTAGKKNLSSLQFESSALICFIFYNSFQHLKQQQEGLSHLISIIKDDLEDIKLVEHGLNETIHIRGGVFS